MLTQKIVSIIYYSLNYFPKTFNCLETVQPLVLCRCKYKAILKQHSTHYYRILYLTNFNGRILLVKTDIDLCIDRIIIYGRFLYSR